MREGKINVRSPVAFREARYSDERRGYPGAFKYKPHVESEERKNFCATKREKDAHYLSRDSRLFGCSDRRGKVPFKRDAVCHDDGRGYQDDDEEGVGEGSRDDIRAFSHRSNEKVEEKEEGGDASAAQGA